MAAAKGDCFQLASIKSGRTLSLLGALIGAVVILGWALEEPRLYMWISEGSGSTPGAGVALLSLGLAMFLATLNAFRRPWRFLLAIPCAVALGLGAGTLVAHFLDADFG